MTYIPLHNTNGSTETVSEANALNNNYWEIDQQLQGFLAANGGNTPISVTGAEIGMQVFSSYVQNGGIGTSAGGANTYASDGTNWHVSDQKEVWSAWSALQITDTTHFFTGNSTVNYRTSNFGRVEWSGAYSYLGALQKGQWLTMHDPATATTKLPWATYGPNIPGGASGPYIVEGGTQFNVSGTGGYGEQVRIGFEPVNVSGTNYVRVRACYTDIATSSNGASQAVFQCTYDSQTPYAGCLV